MTPTARTARRMVLLAAVAVGCGSPSAANIDLRKKLQALQADNDRLTAQHQRDVDTLAATQRTRPTAVTLPPERLAEVFTTHGLAFGRLTGGDNADPAATTDTSLKVYVCPVDDDGTEFKAAGGFTVEAFDLADPEQTLVGRWTFDARQSRSLFYSRLGIYSYVLDCPLGTKPRHADLTVRVTFDDALTGRQFVAQTPAKVRN